MTITRESYIEKYGLSGIIILEGLGGDADEIISTYSADDNDNIQWPLWAQVDPLDGAHQGILSAIQSRYFSSIPRDRAVSVCNVLNMCLGNGSIQIDPNVDLCYNAYEFMAAWNDNHPDEPAIQAPVSFEI